MPVRTLDSAVNRLRNKYGIDVDEDRATRESSSGGESTGRPGTKGRSAGGGEKDRSRTTEGQTQSRTGDNEKPRSRTADFRRNVTDELIARIEQGTAPWQQPWDPSMGNDAPQNAITGKPYRGGNSLWLQAVAPDHDPRWATYKQAQEQGWQVKRGERGTPIEYWEQVRKPVSEERRAELEAEGKEPPKDERKLIHRTYTVFHASQIEGIPPLERENREVPARHELAEQVARSVGAEVQQSRNGQAYYSPSRDTINMPPREAFREPGGYEGVLLHEAGHATGHPSRMDRSIMNKFGSPEYAREELRAEMTSAILSRELGVPHDPSQHASYAGSWAAALKKDPNELFRAAGDAQKMAGWMVERAREQGVEIEASARIAPQRERSEENTQSEERKPEVKTLGEDVRRWTGRVTDVAEDRSNATIRAAGKETVIQMPDGQKLPDGIERGAYGKLSAGRDGAPRFEQAERQRGQSRALER